MKNLVTLHSLEASLACLACFITIYGLVSSSPVPGCKYGKEPSCLYPCNCTQPDQACDPETGVCLDEPDPEYPDGVLGKDCQKECHCNSTTDLNDDESGDSSRSIGLGVGIVWPISLGLSVLSGYVIKTCVLKRNIDKSEKNQTIVKSGDNSSGQITSNSGKNTRIGTQNNQDHTNIPIGVHMEKPTLNYQPIINNHYYGDASTNPQALDTMK